MFFDCDCLVWTGTHGFTGLSLKKEAAREESDAKELFQKFREMAAQKGVRFLTHMGFSAARISKITCKFPSNSELKQWRIQNFPVGEGCEPIF